MEKTVATRGTVMSVVINYPSAQTMATMVKNGEALKRIS